MFFLPLPLDKMLQTLDEVEDSNETLASPELYIIVNGRPTKNKVVWCTLVDVNHIKEAVRKLREINWLYKDVKEDCVDEAVNEVVEVVMNSSCTMLEKATKEDVAGLQCYTIRNLNSKQFTGDDIEQYKLMSVEEQPLDNRQKGLDVMCFPSPFPEILESATNVRLKFPIARTSNLACLTRTPVSGKTLANFYLLWHKEMREISAGVYNILKSHNARPMSAGNMMSKLEVNDQHLEANLCSMLQTVRGTSQFWFAKQGELRCMVQEFGTPTLFLTFSCAEYESHDIITF